MKQVNFRIPLRVLTLLMGLLLSIGAFAQTTVSGIVKDGTGEPVIGATIKVVGTGMGTATDLDGNFTLKNVPEGAQIQISYVGAKTQVVAAAPNLVIELADNEQVLSEVVVIGYGVAKKDDLTGSVTAIKPDSKNHGVLVSAQDALAGKVAGVTVTNSGGTPGGGATIRVRGGSSLSASNDPLIVIDGVPMDNNGVKGLSNPLGMVNPQDIESFTVLKDASATAIYGSRGSNGVVIITTKKGVKGQPFRVSYSGNVTVSAKKKTIDVLSGNEYRVFVKKLYAGSPREEAALAALGSANTDWQNEIMRTAVSTDHNLTFTGSAGTVLPYRVSIGYTKNNGIIKTSSMDRYTAALNLNPSLLNNHLNMNLNAKYMYAKNRYADGAAISNAVRMDPTQPVTAGGFDNFGGYFEWLASNSDQHDSAWPYVTNTNAPRNPVAILEMKNDRAKSHSFIGNADIDYKVHGFEDLRLHLTLGGDFSGGKQDTDELNGNPQNSYYGHYGWEEVTKENLTLSTYAQYYKDFTDKHHFDIMGGYEWQHFWRKEMNQYWGLYPANSALSTAGQIYNKTLLNDGKGFRTENYLVSFFGRMNYIYDNKYFLTATVRNDGSSRFKEHWALFPSLALAWRIKGENFLKENETLSDLKLRLGWGKTGQQEGIGDYVYFANYAMSTGVPGSFYDITGDGSLARPNAYNPNLKWETTTTTNVGLDWGFMNQRISGSIDWYYRKTTDLINYANIAALSNFRNQVDQNIGSLRNTGVELAVSWKAIQTQDLRWTLDYNFTYNDNKILELINDDPNYMVPTGGISSGIDTKAQAHAVGHPQSAFFVYQQVYDKNGKPLEGVVVDRNADGAITEADKYFYKSPWAPVSMAFASRLEYKNWDFGFNLRANIGNYVFNDVMDSYHNVGVASVFESVSGNYFNNRPATSIADGWTTYNNEANLSDRWVQNASFLKLDNITLGYSFDNLFHTGSWGGINGRVYATANNVLTLTKYKGIDPEVVDTSDAKNVKFGIDSNLYPRPFSFIFGLSLNF